LRYRIVETDNFGGDYPDEKFLNIGLITRETAIEIARLINKELSGDSCPRYWKVVKMGYELIPGFEP
jgi:hypothetical protein